MIYILISSIYERIFKMQKDVKVDQLIIPIYINEKIVLDMLAIIEDGFSTVSQVSYNEQTERNNAQKIGAETSTSFNVPLLSKLLKIDFHGEGELSHDTSNENQTSAQFEKVHTNVSLFSKFRTFLIKKEKSLKTEFNISKMQIGDFIEFEGELQKNPLIEYLDKFVDLFRMNEIFSVKAQVNYKKRAKNRAANPKSDDQRILKQMVSFRNELEHSGTTDFVLKSEEGTVVLSVQNQYLTNDNISEILGGRFKVLGKVIAVCKTESEKINLLRKTTLSLLNVSDLQLMIHTPLEEIREKFNFPELITEIHGPAIIVIPIAIYA